MIIKSPLEGPIYVGITGIGAVHGETYVDNNEVSRMIEENVADKLRRGGFLAKKEIMQPYLTDSEWIEKRTGIHSRFLTEGSTSSLAIQAVRQAIECSGHKPEDFDFILFATVSPDYRFSPPTASILHQKLCLEVKNKLGLKNCLTTDLSNACTSVMSALMFGYSLIKSGMAKCGLVVGADKMSSTVDWADRNFAILLGDAAGVFVLERVRESLDSFPFGAAGFITGTDPAGAYQIMARVGGSENLLTSDMLQEAESNPKVIRPDMLWQDGKRVLKDIINLMMDDGKPTPNSIIGRLLADTGLTLDQIDISFLHQANLRINNAIEERMRKAGYKGLVYNTIQEVGNTTSAAIPYGVADAWEKNVLQPGMLVLLAAFGGGYTWAVAPVRWTANIPY